MKNLTKSIEKVDKNGGHNLPMSSHKKKQYGAARR